MSVRNESLAELESDADFRPVLISVALMRVMAENAGNSDVRVDWGEPDADGFYTPTISVTRPLPDPER